jgi:geranylgeranyl diphosphate synthase type II
MMIKQLQQQVEKAIADINWVQEPTGLYQPIDYVLSLGGKRIRPVLTLLACKLFSDDEKQALSTALAVEVFHNFTLLHDDVMDRADTRRGKPTVHKKWNDNTAILSGDAMLIKAYQLLQQAPADKLPVLLDLFSKTAIEVCEGQQYDVDFENDLAVTLPQYIEMIRLKTAVLLAAALKMGAIIGGASLQDANALYDYGINLGLAFQLRDDYLDSFGDPAVFGKKIGGDICCNKKTFLMITALQTASEEQRKELLQWIGCTDATCHEQKIKAVLNIYQNLQIDIRCEEAIRAYFEKSVGSLKDVQLSDNKKYILIKFTNDLMGRNK